MTDADIAVAAERFVELYAKLKSRHPGLVEEAASLASHVVNPMNGTADEVWEKLWDKPLWANARVEQVERKLPSLSLLLSGRWREIALPDGPYAIERTGTGHQAFDVRGVNSMKIVREIKIARHRLFAIVGAARALALWSSTGSAPFAKHAAIPLTLCVPQLRQELGYGWGPITILHFLTDMGLAVKPDIHLVATMRHLGFALANPATKVPTFDEAIWLFDIVKKLALAIKGDVAPASLREMDFLLMRMSKANLLS